ncbi:recombinase family protein [Anaerovibrio sp.]|uniref:recombinase family protein n=1 Tax=Anaerovibrio sp. TaxID=1872532 RepID=UPI003F18AA96
MSRLTVIPATRSGQEPGRQAGADMPKHVAAYCRVSTDSDEQENSYVAQIEHYTEYISNHPDWSLAGIFADEGISGTNTEKRTGFQQMIQNCLAGKIDIVITKSISRFARNTVDCLHYIRKLQACGTEIIFEKENIRTFDIKGEILITIMASLAQQESESLSRNVRMGLKFRYQQGRVMVNHKCFLGYDKDALGNLVVDREQAKVVRRIFREYLDGYTMNQIAAGLERDGVLTGAEHKKWSVSTIGGILANEKYAGDALLQKTVTVDILRKQRIKNDGREPQYYIEDNHEAIISREMFARVQAERKRRWELIRHGSMHKGRYALSGICRCAGCGSVLKRVTWYKPRTMAVWRCSGRIAHGREFCAMKAVQEKYIQAAVVKALNGQMPDSRLCEEYDDLCTRRLVKCVLVGNDSIVVELKPQGGYDSN